MPYPYILKIEAYNSAGEIVKLIAKSLISEQFKDNGVVMTENGQATGTFDPTAGLLNIKFPGIQSPGQEGGDLTSEFNWDGTNNYNQVIKAGTYYIKYSYVDEYDHEVSVIKEIQVLYKDKYLRISIYNSAGEVIRRMNAPTVPDKLQELGMMDTVAVGKGAGLISIEYAAGVSMDWDGKNSQGRLVDSGIYEVRVELNSGTGFETTSAKTITVLRLDAKDIITGVKAYPNPVYVVNGLVKPIKITWVPNGAGKARIDIYNQTAELVARIEAPLTPGMALWDLANSSSEKVSSGLYIIIIHAQKDSGETEIVTTKVSVIRKF